MSIVVARAAKGKGMLRFGCTCYTGGRVMRWCWVNFQCLGAQRIWIRIGQGAYCACRRCGWGLFGHFSLVYHFFFLSPCLWETARYRLKYCKYCLKGSLSPNQPTNQPSICYIFIVLFRGFEFVTNHHPKNLYRHLPCTKRKTLPSLSSRIKWC